jgi:hypothetical protein
MLPMLRELQEHLASLILKSAPLPFDHPFRVPPSGSIDERLHIYAAGYPARLREALAEIFPAVAHLLSDSGLSALVTRYVAACPPRSFNLNDVGAQLPAFLRDEHLGAELPFLADLAELEWRLACAFHAPREDAIDTRHLATIAGEAWNAIVLRFQPGVAVVASDWPIHDVWSARHAALDAIDIDLEGRPQAILVYRVGLETRCELVEPAEGRAMAELLAGRSLGDVLDACEDLAPERLARWFARWMRLELLAGISVRR